MKFILILVSVVLYISLVAAQTCPGRPSKLYPENLNIIIVKYYIQY